MKKTALIIIILFIATLSSYSQSAKDNFQRFYDQKDYEKASQYINDAFKESSKDWNLCLEMGDVYYEMEDYDNALKMYDKSNDLRSGKVEIMRKRAKALTMLHRFPEAVKILREAIKADEKDVHPLLDLANTYIAAGRDSMSQAQIIITRAKDIAGKNSPEPDIALGNLYFSQGVYELAKSNYESALSIDPNNIEVRINLAISYFRLANALRTDDPLANELFGYSLQQWDKVTKQDPKNWKAWQQKGKILYYSSRYGLAAEALSELMKLKPNDSLSRWYLAQSFYEIGKYDSAAMNLEIVEKQMDTVKIKVLLARSYFFLNQFDKSIDKFNKIRATQKLDSNDLKRMMVSYLDKSIRDTNKAVETAEEIINGNPRTSCDLMYKIGRLQLARKMLSSAKTFFIRRLNQAECKDSLNSTISYYVAYCLIFDTKPDSTDEQKAIRAADLDTAKIYLEKTLALDSMRLSAKVLLGDVYINKNDFDNAKETYLQVIESAKRDTLTHGADLKNAFGKVCNLLYKSKSWKELLKEAASWAEWYPNETLPLIYAGLSSQQTKNKDEACKYYKKLLKLDPKNSDAKKNMKYLGCEE